MHTTIIAVRHGETEWNVCKKQQGHRDSSLTERGVLQAQAVARGLGEYHIDHFYSSDLGRAVQTATIISHNSGLSFSTDSRLRERNLGILQGLTRQEFVQRYPSEAAQFESDDPEYVIPDGESKAQRYDRSISCIEEIAQKHLGASICIVTHGGILMSIMHRIMNIPLSRQRSFSLYNGSINIFTVSEHNEWRLQLWGDIHHMRQSGLDFIDDN
jgi:probable phosphoglycerate mutase